MPVPTFPENTPVVWAVGTANKAKIQSVYSVACKLYPSNTHVIFSLPVASGVSDQPMSAVETQTGAVNRAVAALEAAMEKTSGGLLRYSDSQNVGLALGAGNSSNTKATTPIKDGNAAAAADTTNMSSDSGDDDTVFTSVHYGVGLEGGVETVGDKYFECGWMAIAAAPSLTPAAAATTHDANHNDRKNEDGSSGCRGAISGGSNRYRIGIGSSARFEMSGVIMRMIIEEGKELADVMDQLTGQSDVRSNLGAMGVLTAGHLGRAAAYEHGLLFAMAPFLSEDRYWAAS